MKKKIFTLLTLMLAVCGGAWAQDVTPGEANSTYLDISKYSTIADAGFSTGNNATAISYYDESTDWLTVCAYVANQSTSQQKWITSSGSPGADSSKGGWSATDVFKGHSSYFSSGYRTLCVQSAKTISFKVTKCSEIRAYMMPRSKSGRTASMVIYEVDEEGNRNGEAVKTLTASTYNTASVLTASDLDGSKIYEACFLASTANNEFFYEVAFKLADSRTATSLTYSASEATVTLGETFVAPTLTKDPTDLEGVTFSSSNRAVATIDATGAVTILAGGVTTITAEFAGSNTQKPSSASYTLTVTDPSQTSYDSEGVNISWPFNTGAAGQTATITYSNTSLGEELIKSTNVVLGSSLSYNGTQDLKVDNTATGEKTTKIYQSDAGSATDSKHAINFTFTPKLGMTFTPTSVSFVATRCGTNGGAMAINWIDTENATVSLGTAAATSSNTDPARDNNATQNYTEYSYDLSAKGAKATTGECGLQIVTYSASTKNYAIGKVVITGTLSGTISAVVTYTIDANVNDATMGVVDIASAVINEGDGHTIEATANTGYEFVNWTKASDASWTSTTNPLVLSDITADETYTANFVKLNMITFAKGDAEQGTAPGVVYLPNGTTSYTIPANKKLYSAGKTLTKWNNGTTDYAIGATITGISSDITLTAQFEDNTIDLNGLTQESTVAMPFWQSEGAPVLAAEGNSTILVAQAAVGSKFVDILVSIDATSGKFNNNQGNMSACQINATTKLTVPAVSGMTVTIPAEFSTSYLGEESNTGTVASGSTTWTYTGDASTVTLTINESNKYPKSMTIVYPAVASTTISLNSNGYATYSASYDFEVSGAKAYTATLDFDSETITCTEITDGKVPAGTGVLLFGDGGAEMTITPTTGVAALTNNDLKATTLANGSVATMGSNTYYVLNGDTFGKYTGSAFAANKAYFEVEAGSPARAFNIVFNDETTGISTINRSSLTADDYYNLNGQRISQPAKGLYIVNGKKIVVK